MMLGVWSKLTNKTKKLGKGLSTWYATAICFALVMASKKSWALNLDYGDYGKSTDDAKTWVGKIQDAVIPALMGGFFIAGVVLAGMGVLAFANKDSNQQGGAGAWKKVAAGAGLLAFGVLIGVLRSTIKNSGN